MSFWKRVGSGVIMLAIIVAIFILGSYYLAGVLLIVSLLGFWEMSKAFANPPAEVGAERAPLPNKKKIDYMDIIGFVGIVAYYVSMVFLKEFGYQFIVAVLFVLSILFVYVFSFPKVNIDRIAGVVFSFFYCPVMLSFIYLTRETEPYGKYLVWIILISSWGCDSFAYVIGVTLGKKKAFPNLSPKKSIAGCIGGIIASGVLGGLYGYFYVSHGLAKNGNDRPYFFLIVALVSMVGAVMGMLGDLVASGIKRNRGFKDYSKLIPGHGGVLDRFDSLIATAPAIYAVSLALALANLNQM